MAEVRVWFLGCGVRAICWLYRSLAAQALDLALRLFVLVIVAAGAGVRTFDRFVRACAGARAAHRTGQVEPAPRSKACSKPSTVPAAATYAESASAESNSFNTVSDRSGR